MHEDAAATIAVGANLGQAQQAVTRSMACLDTLPTTRVVKRSGLYRSIPVGPPQPKYINAAVLIQTQLQPLALLDALQKIENDFGRRRDDERWGPRTLDLDIITFGTLRMRHQRLILPHPEAYRRCFVLAPLTEVTPQLSLPGYGRVSDLLARCDTGKAVKISSSEEG